MFNAYFVTSDAPEVQLLLAITEYFIRKLGSRMT